MILPMVLGYVVGAVGAYTLLYRKAPVIEEEFFEGKGLDQTLTETTEVIELFSEEETARKAA